MHLIFCINRFSANSLILALKFKKIHWGAVRTFLLTHLWSMTFELIPFLRMLKNLLSRNGLITTRSFFNPCCSIRSISEEEFIFQSGKQINKYPYHEDLDLFIPPSSFGEGTQESWIVVEEEQQLEPKIAKFLASLILEE